jgi:hypothetical protein
MCRCLSRFVVFLIERSALNAGGVVHNRLFAIIMRNLAWGRMWPLVSVHVGLREMQADQARDRPRARCNLQTI